MSPRRLREPMRVYRFGDPDGRFPVFSGEGATLVDGRWHRTGQEVIYTGEHYSTALVEVLVHRVWEMPPKQHFIEIVLPVETTYEEVTKDILPGWDSLNSRVARRHGSKWLDEQRSLILIVPSMVAPEELNILINPKHPDANTIKVGREKPVRWDPRLFVG